MESWTNPISLPVKQGLHLSVSQNAVKENAAPRQLECRANFILRRYVYSTSENRKFSIFGPISEPLVKSWKATNTL